MDYVSRAEESKAYPILVQPSGGSSGRQTVHPQKKEIFSQQPVVRKQTKWSPEENAVIIQLRGHGMKWDDISKRLPGRSSISCRLHYQNYLERRSEWDDDRKNKLARLYDRFKAEMWAKVAEELQIPWRAAEAMHWQLGESDMILNGNSNLRRLVTILMSRAQICLRFGINQNLEL
ncbi:hypothetical protein LMH87_001470 [Akanthomyces muscarius]|uniref:MYB transcription factor n=1 Tax=Akanthomyces muscarius TaxID=2231603 RepID=A0A9W8Q5R3_AKAMU|nr:hypothetical protein LMH87_001470 [Akanthomyces muscarius]KAJ4146914.1 hypothetical protein LMH87_001470 [Akanthomyces muscarius]